MANYSTTAQADGLYQTLTDMANYSTTTSITATFQTLADMANYSTTTTITATFQTLADMANYSTTAQADILYQPAGNAFLTESTANTLYQPIGRYYFAQLNYDLSNMAPLTGKGSVISVPFYTNAVTSAVFLTLNEGSNITTVIGAVYITGTPTSNPPNSQLVIDFYNTSPTITVNTGISYSLLIFNTQ